MNDILHYVKYRNFTYFFGVEIFWKFTVSVVFRANRAETVPFNKIFTTGN